MNSYKLTLLAILASLAVLGRYIFVFLPNVQPVTSLIIICGLLLGPISAMLLAILVTFLSNMLLGMGIWAVWQFISWALIGLISGILRKQLSNAPIALLAVYASLCGFLYGLVISLTSYQISGHFWPYYLAGLPFDTQHAVGNALFILLFYPVFNFLFKRYINSNFPNMTRDI
ncbi:ECF transporter S component [Oceanobacillus kapialis]|uniref:ECF transporter S component n=1 Tax=Oceanobacillus kapialis TaxID=481353 RepID=UPI00384F6AE6